MYLGLSLSVQRVQYDSLFCNMPAPESMAHVTHNDISGCAYHDSTAVLQLGTGLSSDVLRKSLAILQSHCWHTCHALRMHCPESHINCGWMAITAMSCNYAAMLGGEGGWGATGLQEVMAPYVAREACSWNWLVSAGKPRTKTVPARAALS